jgi:hypothetical protein
MHIRIGESPPGMYVAHSCEVSHTTLLCQQSRRRRDTESILDLIDGQVSP